MIKIIHSLEAFITIWFPLICIFSIVDCVVSLDTFAKRAIRHFGGYYIIYYTY